MALSPATAASRRALSVATMASGPLVSPPMASTMARWMKWVVHDSALVLSLLMTSITGLGPMAAPSRQPVMAKRLEQV